MLHVAHDRWGQTVVALRQLALDAAHARSRERFLALHEIAGGYCATQVAERTGRHPQTVMGWVHTYNERGPGALAYRRTGGRPLFVRRSRPPSASGSGPPDRPPPAPRSPGPARRRVGP